MGWRKVSNLDAGSATRFGGIDVDKISDLFSGVDVDDVLIGADWAFKDDKLSIVSTGGVFKYIFSTSGISADKVVTLPLLTADDTFLFCNNIATISYKTFDLTNSFQGVVKLPSSRLTGFAACCHITETGEGLLYGYTKVTTPTLQVTALGLSLQFSSTTTINTSVGMKTPSAVFRRDQNARWKAAVSFDSTASSRLYAGFSSLGTLLGTDTPLANAESGFLFGWRSTDSNIMIFNNDGLGAMNVVDTGVLKSAINPVIVELKLDSTGLISYSVNNGSVNTIITKMPALTTNMFGHTIGQNSTTTQRIMDLRFVEAESDK